jgi:two-component system response regulator
MKSRAAHLGTPEILLVEDNDSDAELTRIGFAQTDIKVNISHVRNGEQCMAFLRKQGDYESAPSPDLILLDLNMPRMNGRDVLVELGRDAQLRHLPVVVLTTSSARQDISLAYDLRCSSYVVKPFDFEKFAVAIQSIVDYWFSVVTLPLRT